MHYQGSCHCGDVRRRHGVAKRGRGGRRMVPVRAAAPRRVALPGPFEFDTAAPIDKVIERHCSMCSRGGYLLTFLPRAARHLRTPLENLATYTFNRHAIQHHFYPRCGAAPFGVARNPQGEETAAINARCVENIDLGSLQRDAVDGRSF